MINRTIFKIDYSGARLIVLSVCLMIVTNGCLVPNVGIESPLSDSEIEESYFRNPKSFETLVKMIQEEPEIDRVAPNFFWSYENEHGYPDGPSKLPDSSLSEERWNTYRELFAKCRLRDGIKRSGDNSVVYFYTGNHKEIYYSMDPIPSNELLKSLDDVDPEETMKFKHLDGNFYISLGWNSSP